jgi:hypothetical protein
MRLTKGQLKRIIREEYSKLKRRGLIRESMDDGYTEPAWTKSRVQVAQPLSQLRFFAKNIVDTAGYETLLRNLEPIDDGALVDYCHECGCSSDAEFVQCVLEYAESMSKYEINHLTDYIAHFGGRY